MNKITTLCLCFFCLLSVFSQDNKLKILAKINEKRQSNLFREDSSLFKCSEILCKNYNFYYSEDSIRTILRSIGNFNYHNKIVKIDHDLNKDFKMALKSSNEFQEIINDTSYNRIGYYTYQNNGNNKSIVIASKNVIEFNKYFEMEIYGFESKGCTIKIQGKSSSKGFRYFENKDDKILEKINSSQANSIEIEPNEDGSFVIKVDCRTEKSVKWISIYDVNGDIVSLIKI